MLDLVTFRVTAPAVRVVQKLKRANIPQYDVKTQGKYTVFSVTDNYRKKVFAIFAHPCYNSTVIRDSARLRLWRLVQVRFGLLLGGIVFLSSVILSGSFIFRVDVQGSGSYLKNEVLGILSSYGVKSGSVYKGFDKPSATVAVMGLPQVVFCSFQKSGSVFTAQVECNPQSANTLHGNLVSTVKGQVERLVCLCGTPAVTEGSFVDVGDTLVYATPQTGLNGLCVGYATIIYSSQFAYPCSDFSPQNQHLALSAVQLYLGEDDLILRQVQEQEGEQKSYSVYYTARRYLAMHIR